MAYRQLYERYEQPFLRTACRMLGRQQEAEEAVQETFLKLHRGIHHYKGGSRFSTYFFRILINTCTDILRQRDPEFGEDLEKAGMAFQPSIDLRQSLEKAIASLPAQARVCFILFAVEELSQTEISQILGIRVGTVKSTLHRARANLRKQLSVSLKGETA
ncbi:MAG: RNA polymerase sigma factor [Candidatus Aminicenantes bacterium]|nr:RNA polymerase sigma factor [Candidatus Aminicenantes bacterium]